jgi:cell division septation protein DedD
MPSFLLVGVFMGALVACAGSEPEATTTSGPSSDPSVPTEQLPLQESGLAVGGDVEESATKVGEFSATQDQLEDIAEACKGAQGIPIEGDDPCSEVQEIPFRPCGPRDICVEIFKVESAGFVSAGYVEVSDRREASSLCESDPEEVCLRIGLTAPALAQLTPATPTTETPTTETPTTETPTTETPTTETPTTETPTTETPTTETPTTETPTTETPTTETPTTETPTTTATP